MARYQAGKDYYGILGVSEDAGEADIRKAYRRLALQWHPDRNPGNPQATEKFKEISEAYGVLMDASKRLQYDQYRKSGTAASFQYTQDDILRDLFRDPGVAAVFEELAREFERMGMRVDRQYFHQTFFGGRTNVSGGIFVVSPFAPVSTLFRFLRHVIRGPAEMQPESPRPRLAGVSRFLSGISRIGNWLLGKGESQIAGVNAADLIQPLELSESEARQGGSRKVVIQTDEKQEQVLLTIPPGIKSGVRLRLKGKGRLSPDGSRGDLYLLVNVT